jgi:hypothetical protein
MDIVQKLLAVAPEYEECFKKSFTMVIKMVLRGVRYEKVYT